MLEAKDLLQFEIAFENYHLQVLESVLFLFNLVLVSLCMVYGCYVLLPGYLLLG